MIVELKNQLRTVKEQRKMVVEPYDKVIKRITRAIKDLETVNEIAEEANARTVENIETVTELGE